MFKGKDYVQAVWKEGSFSRAAEKLMISQPALSAAVRREETELGCAIFDRSRKPIGLTEVGRRYLDAAQRIDAVERQFTDEIRSLDQLAAGTVTIGATSLYSSYLLPHMMADFHSRYPRVDIVVKERNTDELFALLQREEADLILENYESRAPQLRRAKIKDEYLLLAVPEGFTANRGLTDYRVPYQAVAEGSFLDPRYPAVPLAALMDEPFILLRAGSHTRQMADRLFAQQNRKPQILLEVDQQITSGNITAEGLGISFLSSTLISGTGRRPGVLFYKLPPEASRRSLYFYWPAGRWQSKAAARFIAVEQGFDR